MTHTTGGAAQELSEHGKWISNVDRIGNVNPQQPLAFKADFIIHWRPDGKLNYTEPDEDLAIAITC
jgi:hypothetical protein